MRAVFVSPHLDDAAFSVGALIAGMKADGWDVHVATLLTAAPHPSTGFALACQLDKGLSPDIDYMTIRRQEDRLAMKRLGVSWSHHPFTEAPHRGYESAEALFGNLRTNDGLMDELGGVLRSLFCHSDIIFAPYALGNHVDHIIIRDAVLNAAPEVPVLLWRDLPYALREPDQIFWHFVRARKFLEAKFAACAAYTSQIGFQFGNAERLRKVLNDDYVDQGGEGLIDARSSKDDIDLASGFLSNFLSVS